MLNEVDFTQGKTPLGKHRFPIKVKKFTLWVDYTQKNNLIAPVARGEVSTTSL